MVPDVVEGLPNVARWAQAMGERPAIQRALKF
jgi:glutathione S-transferase